MVACARWLVCTKSLCCADRRGEKGGGRRRGRGGFIAASSHIHWRYGAQIGKSVLYHETDRQVVASGIVRGRPPERDRRVCPVQRGRGKKDAERENERGALSICMLSGATRLRMPAQTWLAVGVSAQELASVWAPDPALRDLLNPAASLTSSSST